MARYLRADELHRAFTFHLLHQPWSARAFRTSIDATRRELDPIGATATWVLSNHDVVRAATRYGGGPTGVQRARAAAMLVLGLPGSACLYQGDELGLEDVDVPPEARQDPIHRLGAGTGRDGCRVPIPWARGGAPGFGFTTGAPWLPTPAGWGEQSVEAQDRDPRSTLALYRRLLALRRGQGALRSDTMAWREAPDGCLAFRRGPDGATVVDVVVNMGDDPVEVAATGRLLAASDESVAADHGRVHLPAATAAWLAH
jgi:alpha-glucosidase